MRRKERIEHSKTLRRERRPIPYIGAIMLMGMLFIRAGGIIGFLGAGLYVLGIVPLWACCFFASEIDLQDTCVNQAILVSAVPVLLRWIQVRENPASWKLMGLTLIPVLLFVCLFAAIDIRRKRCDAAGMVKRAAYRFLVLYILVFFGFMDSTNVCLDPRPITVRSAVVEEISSAGGRRGWTVQIRYADDLGEVSQSVSAARSQIAALEPGDEVLLLKGEGLYHAPYYFIEKAE